MRIAVIALVLVALASGCDSTGVEPATSLAGVTTSVVTTTTMTEITIDVAAACVELVTDAVGWLESAVDTLDVLPSAAVTDPASWPAEVTALRDEGRELDARAAGLGCDPGTIQAGVLREASAMRADGRTGAYLLLLLRMAQGG